MTHIKNGLYYGVLILLLIVAFVSFQSRLADRQPSLCGYQFLNVISGSMSPTINKGSLIIVREIEGEDVLPQDVITFRGDNGQYTTHRVVKIQQDDSIQFVTKGDANQVVDPVAVEEERLVGKVIFFIPYVGAILEIMKENPIVLLTMVVAGVMISVSVKWLFQKKSQIIKPDQI